MESKLTTKKITLYAMAITLAIYLIRIFIERDLPNSDIDNTESLEKYAKTESVYDSLFLGRNYIYFWNHDFWSDNSIELNNANSMLFWYKHRGVYTTTAVNLRNRPFLDDSEIIEVIPDSTYGIVQWATKNPNPYKDWFEVGVGDQRGWIYGKYLRPATSYERSERDALIRNRMFSVVLKGASKSRRTIAFLTQFIIPIIILLIKRLIGYRDGWHVGLLVLNYFDLAALGFILFSFVFKNLHFILYELVPQEYFVFVLFIVLGSFTLGLIIDLSIKGVLFVFSGRNSNADYV